MKRQKVPDLGTAFLVPLRDNGFALGVLTRADGEGRAFGYFFGPRLSRPTDVALERITPEDALLVGMFGDLEFLRGNWPLVGRLACWSPENWPLPALSRVDEHAGRAWITTYDDALDFISEAEIDPEGASRYPYDRFMGSGAVEVRLTELIKVAEGGL